MKNLRDEIIEQCVPGGDICDPQEVADGIRAYFKTRCWHCAAPIQRLFLDMPEPVLNGFENAHLCPSCLTLKTQDREAEEYDSTAQVFIEQPHPGDNCGHQISDL